MSLRSQHLLRFFDGLTIVIVLAVLAVPSIDAVARPVDERSSLREQRTPAPLPAFPQSFAEFSTFMRRFDTHFRDTFGARDWLLAAHQWLALGALPRDPSPKIVHGHDGWLFWDPANARDVHRGAKPFTPRDLETWVLGIEQRRAACEALGARYVLALAPAKETIYPDYYPPQFAPIGPTRYDQLAEKLARESGVTFVDLRPALHAERAFDDGGDRAYSRLGSHWTHRGASAASRVLLAALPLTGVIVPPREFWHFTLSVERGESLADLTYVADRFQEPLYAVLPLDYEPGVWSETHVGEIQHIFMDDGDPALPKLVLVHDSFAAWILPFLAPHFGRIHAIGQPILPLHIVHENQPDIVIDLHTEHVLDTWGYPPPIPTTPTEALTPRGAPAIRPRLVRLSAKEFANCERLGGELDISALTDIELRGGARALPRTSSTNTGVEIEFTSVGARLVIGGSAITAERQLALHVRITSPGASEMGILWHSRAEGEFSRRNRLVAILQAGENDLLLALKDVPPQSALALMPSRGRYTITAIEVRAR